MLRADLGDVTSGCSLARRVAQLEEATSSLVSMQEQKDAAILKRLEMNEEKTNTFVADVTQINARLARAIFSSDLEAAVASVEKQVGQRVDDMRTMSNRRMEEHKRMTKESVRIFVLKRIESFELCDKSPFV